MDFKSQDLLKSFNYYCITHPKERFWQALRNWAGVNFILAVKGSTWCDQNAVDTFNWNKRNPLE